MEHDKLPPLPEPDHPADADGCTYAWREGFSSDQMRAYAAQAVAAERERWLNLAQRCARAMDDYEACAYGRPPPEAEMKALRDDLASALRPNDRGNAALTGLSG